MQLLFDRTPRLPPRLPTLAEWGPSTFWWVAKILGSLIGVEICFVFLLQNPADVQRAAERTMPRVAAPAMFDVGREAEEPVLWASVAPAPAPPAPAAQETVERVVEYVPRIVRVPVDNPVARQRLSDAERRIAALETEVESQSAATARARADARNANERLETAIGNRDEWMQYARRLEAQVARRSESRALIGYFDDRIEVYQSPPPGFEFVNEPITMSLSGNDAMMGIRWSTTCGNRVGGSSGRVFTFRAMTPMICTVTIVRNGRPENYQIHILLRR